MDARRAPWRRAGGRARAGERGTVTVLLAAFVVVAGVLLLGLGRLGGGAVARARARTAADAAALAGAAEGSGAAEAVAAANGATLLGWEELGSDVRVEVGLDDARASARARRFPPPTRGWPVASVEVTTPTAPAAAPRSGPAGGP